MGRKSVKTNYTQEIDLEDVSQGYLPLKYPSSNALCKTKLRNFKCTSQDNNQAASSKMIDCGKCSYGIRTNQPSIQCKSCLLCFHVKCTEVVDKKLNAFGKPLKIAHGVEWNCVKCSEKYSSSTVSEILNEIHHDSASVKNKKLRCSQVSSSTKSAHPSFVNSKVMCHSCLKLIRSNQNKVICDGHCKSSFHLSCVNISKYEFDAMYKIRTIVSWFCNNCKSYYERPITDDCGCGNTSSLVSHIQDLHKKMDNVLTNFHFLCQKLKIHEHCNITNRNTHDAVPLLESVVPLEVTQYNEEEAANQKPEEEDESTTVPLFESDEAAHYHEEEAVEKKPDEEDESTSDISLKMQPTYSISETNYGKKKL